MSRPARLDDADLRFGEWGPGYLTTAPDLAVGVVVLRPSDEFANHLHERHTESFVVLEGRAELWLDRAERLDLVPGDVISVPAGREHYLRGIGDVPFRAVFLKTPWVDGDKVDADWTP
jgi:quercetin dioxygenase-like cupin family protein